MSSIELVPGVVVDTDRGAAYLMSPDGGILALRLASGEALWHSRDADKPLAVAGDLLVGQADDPGPANELRIVSLQTRERGGERASESLVPLPPGVEPAIEETMGRAFIARAEPLDDDIALSWESVEQPIHGANMTEVEILPGEEVPHVDTPSPAPGLSAMAAAQPEEQSTALRGAVRLCPADGTLTPLVEAHAERAPGFARPLGAGPAPEAGADEALPDVREPRFLSGDGRHVLHSERIADSSEWDRYHWTVYDRATGERIGAIRTHASYSPFVVVERLIIFESQAYERSVGGQVVQEPLQVRSYDLRSEALVWQREVRDTMDTTPPPP